MRPYEYEEALMEVEEIAYKQYEDACYNKTTKARAMEYERKLKDDTKILQELVNKETPVKPYKSGPWDDVDCQKCRNTVCYDEDVEDGNTPNYCKHCGQRLDWSDEE